MGIRDRSILSKRSQYPENLWNIRYPLQRRGVYRGLQSPTPPIRLCWYRLVHAYSSVGRGQHDMSILLLVALPPVQFHHLFFNTNISRTTLSSLKAPEREAAWIFGYPQCLRTSFYPNGRSDCVKSPRHQWQEGHRLK